MGAWPKKLFPRAITMFTWSRTFSSGPFSCVSRVFHLEIEFVRYRLHFEGRNDHPNSFVCFFVCFFVSWSWNAHNYVAHSRSYGTKFDSVKMHCMLNQTVAFTNKETNMLSCLWQMSATCDSYIHCK